MGFDRGCQVCVEGKGCDKVDTRWFSKGGVDARSLEVVGGTREAVCSVDV